MPSFESAFCTLDINEEGISVFARARIVESIALKSNFSAANIDRQ